MRRPSIPSRKKVLAAAFGVRHQHVAAVIDDAAVDLLPARGRRSSDFRPPCDRRGFRALGDDGGERAVGVAEDEQAIGPFRQHYALGAA